MRKIALLALLGLFLSLVPRAGAVPMFARMYSYNCTMCHDPGYGQLNKFGYNFRAAGYRNPADIGKDMNDGKFDMTNYIAARFSAGGSLKTTSLASGAATPDSGTFTLGGASLYLGGGISKHFFAYSELGLGNGSGVFPSSPPSLSTVKMGYVTGTENEFFTVRVGKFGPDGFGGGDRGPVGNATIASAVKPTGTGVEVGYTHVDTRVTLGFFNGIQNPQITGIESISKAGAVTTTVAAPQGFSSDSNNSKDIYLFVNQFIGDDGLDLCAAFYNGYDASAGTNTVLVGGTGDSAGVEYYNTALFITSPIIKKLDIKVGGELGQTNAGVFATTGVANPANGGFFGELDYAMDDLTPLVFRCDFTMSALNNPLKDVQKYTLGALTPFVEQVYMNPTITMTRTNKGLINGIDGYDDAFALSDSLFVFF